MKNAIILHGTDASPESNWFQWIKSFMEKRGYDVWLPQLPNSATPNVEIYNAFIFNKPDFTFNEETILIGHSSGAVEILSLLQHLPAGTTVGDVYLVSAFKDALGMNALDGLFIEPFDFELIKTKARSITLIHSDDDPYVPSEHAYFLSNKLDARLLMFTGQGHFNLEQSEDYHEFPLLAQVIETNGILNSKDKLSSFRGEAVKFIESQSIKGGVECDVYSFTNNSTKDLGIIRIKKGSKTPKQRIINGDKTIEGFLFGRAGFAYSSKTRVDMVYEYSDSSYGLDTVLSVGDTMQWFASEDTVIFEICYPPFDSSRFEEL